MANNYGDNPPLSYNKYLRVADLINLQDCLSSPIHHDELLFITVHQAYELWFKQILHELDAAVALLEEDRVPAATRALRRVVDIEKLLVNQIHILETMTPISFLAFRDQLNPASGFQSMQFREIEFSSGLKDKNILREFASDQFAHERLQARINQLTDKLEATLRQSLRIAQAANAWHGDANADAAVLMAYVVGRWQLFAKSGFKRSPQDGWALQRKFLFG